MRRLLCRWVEYYLALSDEDMEPTLPAWVRRHLDACTHCQAALRAYRHTLEMVHQYAQLLPSTPPEGWRPLEVNLARTRRAVPWQQIVVAAGVVAAVLWAALQWHKGVVSMDERDTRPQLAQGATTPQRVEVISKSQSSVSVPSASPPHSASKRQEPRQVRPVTPQPPAPANRSLPVTPLPPKRVVVAAQPKQGVAPLAQRAAAAEAPPEPPAPVQPVLAEVSPSSSAEVPEAYVLQPAYAAAAGGVE